MYQVSLHVFSLAINLVVDIIARNSLGELLQKTEYANYGLARQRSSDNKLRVKRQRESGGAQGCQATGRVVDRTAWFKWHNDGAGEWRRTERDLSTAVRRALG